jgi:phenylacetate-CoA ligase
MTILTTLVEAAYGGLARCSPLDAWRWFERLQRHNSWTAERLALYRRERLVELVEHAGTTVPFYRQLWSNAGIDPTGIRTFEDLQTLPVVSKHLLIEAQERDAFALENRSDYQLTHTSGTTGPRLALPFSRGDLQKKYASFLREYYATGWRLGIRSAALHYAGHPEFGGRYTGRPDRDGFALMRRLAFRFAHRRRLLTPWSTRTYDGTEELPALWYRSLLRHRPWLLESMDFNLIALYRYLKRQQLEPPKIPVMLVLATLARPLRDRLERFFGGRIYNRFGPHEIEGVAFPCAQREGLHVATDVVHVEVLDDRDQPVLAGQTGHLVLTDLDSRLMPLIRYRIGDMGRLFDHPCVCGSPFPLMSDLQGRTRDRLLRAGGEWVPGAGLVEVLQSIEGLELFQLVQDESGAVELRLAPSDAPHLAGLHETVTRAIAAVLGDTTAMRLCADRPLELERNGKFSYLRRLDDVAQSDDRSAAGECSTYGRAR